MTKVCNVCEQILPLSMYGRNKLLKSGIENTCKKCRTIRRPRVIIACKQCNSDFVSMKRESKFCGAECAGLFRRRRVNKICETCGKKHEILRSKDGKHEFYYCSQDCRTIHLKELMLGENNPYYNRVPYICDGCKKDIMVVPHKTREQRYIFCSNDCYKENIGQYFSGENNPWYNPNLTEKDRLRTRGYKEYEEWRFKVFERDKFSCRLCRDDQGGNLEAHHIYNYSEHEELRLEVSNGITFCEDCHKEFHKIYGYRNNDIEQLNEFLHRALIPQ